uniref:Uncharacterized protein n=1 Tax=Rhizophora mucronata TaxID=61149 RepID=A0A2P2QQA5_RHIMU
MANEHNTPFFLLQYFHLEYVANKMQYL